MADDGMAAGTEAGPRARRPRRVRQVNIELVLFQMQVSCVATALVVLFIAFAMVGARA